MSDPIESAPTSFDAARRWTASRVNVLNKMSSRELALSPAFGAEAKAKAFFSAKVAEARVLDKLREVSDDFSAGRIGLAEARAKLKGFLAKEGHSPDDVTASTGQDRRNRLDNLASTARLDLILNQNARMAAAVGQREVSMDPDLMERWPYFRYIPSVSKNKRAAHSAFYNLILRKDDPFWRTHTPPLDFNCKCSMEDADQEEADAAGGVARAEAIKGAENSWGVQLPNGQSLQVDTPASGYVFDVGSAMDSCDMSLVKDIPTRRKVLKDLRDYAGKVKAPGKVIVKGETTAPAVSGGASPQELGAFLAKAQAVNRLTKKVGGEILSLGSLSQEMMDAVGIVEKTEMSLVLTHTVEHHYAELLNGDIPKILAETLGSPGVTASMTLKSNTAVLTLAVRSKDNPGKDAIAVFQLEDEKDWSKWKLLSVHYDDPGYMDSKRIVTK